MISLIYHNLSTIVVSIILLVIILLIIRSLKKQGSSCDGGCSGCGSSSICHSKENAIVKQYHNDATKKKIVIEK